MQTAKDIRRRATGDLRRHVFKRGVFRRDRMREIADALARKYAGRMPPENLLALARRSPWLKDTWLKGPRLKDNWLESGRGGTPHSKRPSGKADRIAEKLGRYLRSELRGLVDTFWEGRTSVELIAKGSSVELAGFFNGERPI